MKLPCLDQKQKGNLTTRDLNSQFSCRSDGQLESAADASLCTYKLIQDLHPITIPFWGLRNSAGTVKKHRTMVGGFVNSKSPREHGTIPHSSAFTSSQTSPKHNYVTKQGIMHSCPGIFLERASLKVQNYRTLELHYTPQKQETDWETNWVKDWVGGRAALHRTCSQILGEGTRAPLALRDADWYYWVSSRTGKTPFTPIL